MTPPASCFSPTTADLAYRLTHPSYQVPRIYRVTVAGEVSPGDLAPPGRRGEGGGPHRDGRGGGDQKGGG